MEVKPIIIAAALLVAVGSAVAQQRMPVVPINPLSAWPHLPVIEYDKWQWVYLPKAPNWHPPGPFYLRRPIGSTTPSKPAMM